MDTSPYRAYSCNYPRRGEIYFLDFKDTQGQAMRKRHPALIVQNNTANRYSGVILVAPLTTNLKVANLPVGVMVEPPEGGLKKRSVIHCGQIHTIDRDEFTPDRLTGQLSLATMQKVDRALKTSLSLL